MARTKIVVVESDLEALSRIYLGLLHRNYRVETSSQLEGVTELLKRVRPAVLILGKKEYEEMKPDLRIPVVVYADAGSAAFPHPDDVFVLRKPVQLDELITLLERIVY